MTWKSCERLSTFDLLLYISVKLFHRKLMKYRNQYPSILMSRPPVAAGYQVPTDPVRRRVLLLQNGTPLPASPPATRHIPPDTISSPLCPRQPSLSSTSYQEPCPARLPTRQYPAINKPMLSRCLRGLRARARTRGSQRHPRSPNPTDQDQGRDDQARRCRARHRQCERGGVEVDGGSISRGTEPGYGRPGSPAARHPGAQARRDGGTRSSKAEITGSRVRCRTQRGLGRRG